MRPGVHRRIIANTSIGAAILFSWHPYILGTHNVCRLEWIVYRITLVLYGDVERGEGLGNTVHAYVPWVQCVLSSPTLSQAPTRWPSWSLTTLRREQQWGVTATGTSLSYLHSWGVDSMTRYPLDHTWRRTRYSPGLTGPLLLMLRD